MRKTVLICLLGLACLPGLTACAGGNRNSPDFKAGYSDGCASANLQGANPRETGMERDESAYRANKDYRAGWGQGFGSCRAMTMPMPSSPGAGPFGPTP